jgi:3',5'-cyclic-AMP phosphodiesterase
MRILELTEKPIHRIQFLNAAKGGGVESQALPILQGKVDVLPKGLEALLVIPIRFLSRDTLAIANLSLL